MQDEIEVAVTAFRAELEGEAIDSSTVDELEDHYREAIAAQRAKGISPAIAIRVAGSGLGDLRAVARECSRVRSNFGPRPTRFVAWSVATLIVVWLGMHYRPVPFGSPFDFHAGEVFVAGCGAVSLALMFRSSQALALAIGFLIPGLASTMSHVMREHHLIWFHNAWFVEGAIYVLIVVQRPRFTRSGFAMVAVGWMAHFVFMGAYNQFSSGPFDFEMTVLLPGLLTISVLMIGARIRGAWMPCLAMFCAVVPALRVYFERMIDPVWGTQFSWSMLFYFFSPLMAAILAAGNTRSLRDALQPLRDRINGAPPTQAA
jgi:hypothetical protein